MGSCFKPRLALLDSAPFILYFLNSERIVENLIPSGVSSFLLFYLLIHPGKCEDTGPLNLFSLPFLFFPLGLGDWRG